MDDILEFSFEYESEHEYELDLELDDYVSNLNVKLKPWELDSLISSILTKE